VAVVSPYDLGAKGGVQDQVIALVEGLAADGHEAWAVAPGTGGPAGTRHVGGVVSVPANRSRAPISVDPMAMRRVRAAIAGADVVHVHEPLMPAVSLGALVGAHAPLVATFHADPGPVVRRTYRASRAVLRSLLRRADVVTAVSPVAAAAVAPFAEARIVPNGVDVTGFPQADPIAGRVAFLGRDERRKGLTTLLQAWPLVHARLPYAELRVMGAERPSGPEGVVFLGRVEEEAKRTGLASSAVYCAPNLGGESFGIVLVEAMAAGCAVVASDLPAFRHVGGDAVDFVAPGDPGALAGAILALLADEPRRRSLAAAGRARAGRFALAAVRQAYLEAYRDAAASR
jgi:phosphatidylinositol alpha-mannosyltransferase